VSDMVSIVLPQLVLWYDSTRIQTWPAIMAKARPEAIYASTRAFGKEFYTDRLTYSGHSAADNMSKNLPGLETRRSRLVLRGIGLLEKTKGGYRVSEHGKRLGEQYQIDPGGTEWVKTLGRLLLLREPRTRVLVKLLSEPGAALYFTDDGWWGGAIRRAVIKFEDGRRFLPFNDRLDESYNLREAMNADSWWALGRWRDHPLLEGVDDCEFVGQAKERFSLHALSVPLRGACEVLQFLGVLRHQADRCWLDHDTAAEVFGMALAEDFGWKETGHHKPFYEWLTHFAERLRVDTGFIVASELRNMLRAQGFENPDREIAQLESEGRVVIEASDYGQSRHGVGLYDDPGKQLIKLRVC